MLNAVLDTLKDYILQYNTYFENGYSNAYVDEQNGLISDDTAQKDIFPMDTEGNYFYLRLPKEMNFVYDATKYKLSDCDFQFGISARVYLVAFVRRGDADTLFNNLVATLQTFTQANLRFIGGIVKKELVINQELKKYAKGDIEKALRNIKQDDALISISFDVATRFENQKLSCITNPCAVC